MPTPKNTYFRFRELPKKDGKQRRQRLAFNKGKVIESDTFEKRKDKWVNVSGDETKRGTRRTL